MGVARLYAQLARNPGDDGRWTAIETEHERAVTLLDYSLLSSLARPISNVSMFWYVASTRDSARSIATRASLPSIARPLESRP